MSNPTGINQYTGKGKSSPAKTAAAKAYAEMFAQVQKATRERIKSLPPVILGNRVGNFTVNGRGSPLPSHRGGRILSAAGVNRDKR